VSGKYAADVDLARRCAAGDEAAWERFVLEYRPLLYRAADAIEPGGGARELADALYADLYGLTERDGERRSLFRYFQGRSSLATWLRAVLAQRYVDRVRERRRFEPLPDDEERRADHRSSATADPDSTRLVALMEQAVEASVAELDSRDRLRLGCYYVQELTLAETGRVLREHEATASRQLARTRTAIRESVERRLRQSGLNDSQIADCFAAAASDSGHLDLSRMVSGTERKESTVDRSK
jgi:RNA polymerase sigma-70 factor (ECF subfamily)